MKHRLAINGRMVELDDDQLLGLATGKAAKAIPLTFELRILARLCENHTSMSATSIAAEEWQGWNDPVNVNTVVWALESLNEQGLVTYLLEGSPGWTEQPVRIRPTRAGYAAAGYPPPVTILLGRKRNYHADVPRHLNDSTDFRNFLDVAIGGPVERDSLEHHLEKYPEHATIHPTMEELRMTRQDVHLAANAVAPADDGRGLVRMTADQMMAEKEEQMAPNPDARTERTPDLASKTVDEIVEERGVHWRTAFRMRKEATADVASEGASDSLAHKILEILKNGDVNNIEDMRSALFFAHEDLHANNIDITKAIWSLQKRALVTFYERKHGRDSLITKIKLTKRGMTEMGVLPERHSLKPDRVVPSRELKHPSKVGKDPTDFKNQPSVTNGGPIERRYVEPVVDQATRAAKMETPPPGHYAQPARSTDPPRQNEKPQTFADEYPLIADLMGKEDRLKGYEAAAKALEGFDEEMALALLDKIQLTDLEKEVIRYVRALGPRTT